MKVEFAHEITIKLPIGEAFPFFTPKGEESWVPKWAPVYISPTSGETTKEMLFRTGDGDETTYWTCLEYEPENFHARYLRLTPASQCAIVDVICRSPSLLETIVKVKYCYIALNEAGRASIAKITSSTFRKMINQWHVLIGQKIQGKPKE